MSNSHLLVVGSGIAGLYGALLAAESGIRVTLLTKGRLQQSNTHYAQGGICAVLPRGEAAPGDSIEAHIADTLTAGAGHCDPDAVRILCTEAAADIAALERLGITFDTAAQGRRALGLEAAHSAARILHAGGDATGAVIADGLIDAVRRAAALGLITVREHCFVTELLQAPLPATEPDDADVPPAVVGAAYLDARDVQQSVAADAVLLATGGAGQLFASTTNPGVATGDGVALAWRAGAVVGDLEYYQFHPTALAVGRHFLISEAVRGAGAVLRDAGGERFMPHYHPDAELAPRDVVSRSIAARLADRARAGSAGTGTEGCVYLDATGVEEAHGAGHLAARFPTIHAATARLGFDWTQQWLPVTPAAHYWMGGIVTDLHGRTSVPGLYAAGEVACTGVHGANRLASNSLLEGLVFSRRAVAAMVDAAGREPDPLHAPEGSFRPHGNVQSFCPVTGNSSVLSRQQLQHLMSGSAGVVRRRQGLHQALARLTGGKPQEDRGPQLPPARLSLRERAEDDNLLLLAQLLLHAALMREESAGTHYREDFPQGNALNQRAVNLWRKAGLTPPPISTTVHHPRESETV